MYCVSNVLRSLVFVVYSNILKYNQLSKFFGEGPNALHFPSLKLHYKGFTCGGLTVLISVVLNWFILLYLRIYRYTSTHVGTSRGNLGPVCESLVLSREWVEACRRLKGAFLSPFFFS